MAHGARRIAITLACGAALGVAAVAAVDAVDEPAGAQANKISVTAGQLQVNQRISQAAVRRSNESLNLLRPVRPTASTDRNPTNPFNAVTRGTGWPTSAIAEQAIEWQQIYDGAGGPISTLYRIEGIPMAYLIGADGAISARGLRGQRLLDAVADALGEKEGSGE